MMSSSNGGPSKKRKVMGRVEEDTQDNEFEGSEVQEQGRAEAEVRGATPFLTGALTRELVAGIIPFLRLHYVQDGALAKDTPAIVECPWKPRDIDIYRLTDLKESLEQEQPGCMISCMDGQTMLFVITTFSNDISDANITQLQPLIANLSYRGKFYAESITPEILQQAIVWVTKNKIVPTSTNMFDLLATYLEVLEAAFVPKPGKTFRDTLLEFLNNHEWNCLKDDANAKEKFKISCEGSGTFILLHFILLHLPFQTKVVAHVINGQHRVTALEWLMYERGDDHGGWQRLVQSMFYLPTTVDSNFGSQIKNLSTKHQMNTSLMQPHTVIHFFQLVDQYYLDKLQNFPLLQDWVQQVYDLLLRDDVQDSLHQQRNYRLHFEELVAKLMSSSGLMGQRRSNGWATKLMENFLQVSAGYVRVADLLVPCIDAWIIIFAYRLYWILVELKQLTALAGFSLPSQDAFLKSFKMTVLGEKKMNMDIFPYTAKRIVTIKRSRRAFPGRDAKNNDHPQTMFLQILLWSRLSKDSLHKLRAMMTQLSQAQKDQADRILWNFFHSVVDEVSISKPIWEYGFFCKKDNKGQQLLHVQSNPMCVQKFCLLLSAVDRCASAFTDWSNSSPLEVQALFFSEKALTQDDFPDYQLTAELWQKLSHFYTSFFGSDGFTFVAVAHSLYLSLNFDPYYAKMEKENDRDFYKKKFEVLAGSWDTPDGNDNPLCPTNAYCPFGDPNRQIHCVGDSLSVFSKAEVFQELKQLVLDMTSQEYSKSLISCRLASQVGAGAQAPHETTTETQLQLPAPGQPTAQPVAKPAGVDLNNPLPVQPPNNEIKNKKSTRKKQGNQTQEKQGNQTTVTQKGKGKDKPQTQEKQGNQTKVTQKGKGKEKPPLVQVDIGIENAREIYKLINLVQKENTTLIPSIEQYMKILPRDSCHTKLLNEFRQRIQTVVKLAPKLKKKAKSQRSTSGKAQSALLNAVRNEQERDQRYEQDIAFHQTEVAGRGADEAPSDPEPEDDSAKPYPNHPCIDDAAKEGKNDEDSVVDEDYNTFAGTKETSDDETPDKIDLAGSIATFLPSNPDEMTIGSLEAVLDVMRQGSPPPAPVEGSQKYHFTIQDLDSLDTLVLL